MPHRLLLLACLLALAACGPEPRPSGTARMADTLDALASRAEAAPMPYFVLNEARADRLEASLTRYGGTDLLRARFDLARERLNAGQTDAAIRHLVDLGEAVGGVDAIATSPEARPVFALLATAYLRRGEQANCLANHHAGEVCVLPFRDAAIHADPDGASRAADLLANLTAAEPGDLANRWLLNVAHHALGGYPESVPEAARIDGLDAEPGPIGQWTNVAPMRGAAIDGLSGGVSFEDFDGDGDPDLFVTSYGLRDPIRYLENNGGAFTDQTERAGLDGLIGGLNTVHADVDSDGDADVLVLRGGWFGAAGAWPNSLLLNDGTGRFEDVTYAAGLGEPHPTQTAAFADVDADGDLDLFIGNESGGAYPDALGETAEASRHPSHLFLNEGTEDGIPRFREAAREAGIDLGAFVKGVTFLYADGDDRPDLFVSVLGGENRLYLNRSTNGRARFEPAPEAGVAAPLFSFPVVAADFDGDGLDDLFVGAYDVRRFFQTPADAAREWLGEPPVAETSRLFLGAGDGSFRDATEASGLGLPLFGMGLNTGDLDGDGRLDLYVGTGAPDLRSLIPNRAFLNRGTPGAPRFEDVTLSSGLGHLQKGHAVAFADADGDGDEDLYAVMGGAVQGDLARNVLFENPGTGRWYPIGVHGPHGVVHGTRLAITLREADGTERRVYRTVGTGGSFGASALRVHVGLGETAEVVGIATTHPDGSRHTWSPGDPPRLIRPGADRPREAP
ncbi:MAG: CRTAC1 family protein [Bacteroidota bacterium]